MNPMRPLIFAAFLALPAHATTPNPASAPEIHADTCTLLYDRAYDLVAPVMIEAGLPPYGDGASEEMVDTLLAAEAEGYPAAVAAVNAMTEASKVGCE